MIKMLRQESVIQYKWVHSYTQETNVFIHISRYSSAFIMLEVRLTKYQQIHSDIQCAAHQMFTCLFTHWGVCLVMAGGLTQDLTLILSTKNTEQNKTKKRKPKQESIYYKRSGEGFIVKNICCALLPATTSLKMPIVKKTCCVLLPLSFMKSFKMKICCVLLPASLWRRYSCVLLSSSAVYFYQCVYQKLCLRCQVPSREGLYEWDMLPIKI